MTPPGPKCSGGKDECLSVPLFSRGSSPRPMEWLPINDQAAARQGFQKLPSVALGQDARIQYCDRPLVAGRADQASEALLEFDDGVG